jgi:hypothetical protein
MKFVFQTDLIDDYIRSGGHLHKAEKNYSGVHVPARLGAIRLFLTGMLPSLFTALTTFPKSPK